jgi:Phosphodiester glycosidase
MNGYVLGNWRNLFQIDNQWLETIQFATGKALPGSEIAAEHDVTIVRIDLFNTPGLQFYTSPKADLGPKTIEQFLTAADTPLSTVLAINGALAATQDGNVYLFGAAISQGNVVCDPTQPAVPGGQPDVRNSADAGTVALTITEDLQAAFQTINAATGLPEGWANIYTAVSGSPNVSPGVAPPLPFNTGLLQPGQAMVLMGGVNQGLTSQDTLRPEGDAVWVAGRTAVGLSSNQQFLFLLTANGVENGTPAYGATFYDVGQWLLAAGASDGVTLDGGGSTAMAMMAPQVRNTFAPVLMNVPYGTESTPYYMRANNHYFGVVLPGVIGNTGLIRKGRQRKRSARLRS